MQEKESKLLYSFCIPFNEQQRCHVTNIYTERKNKSIILHYFARKTKVSYYITYFQTLLRPFSCDICYSDRTILSYCEKRKVTSYVCKKNNIFLWTNNILKCRVTNVYTVKEKQKYHITFFCEKNKSIILHSFARKTKVSYYITFFQTLLKTFSCGLCYSDGRIILYYCEKRKVNYYVCKKNNIFLSMNNKCHVRKSRNIYTVEEKQKYHITSRSSKLSWERFSCGLCHAEIATAMYKLSD